jgi:hypothetical protein
MTKKEALQVLAILKAAYPASYNGTKEEAAGTVSVWCMQFADVPADIVLMAIHKLISTSKFPPTVAEVKSKISALHWEAYSALSDGMRYNRISEEEKQAYQRIYDLTEGYSGNREPTLPEMIGGGRMLLGKGDG